MILPDANGEFGGVYVGEILVLPLLELQAAMKAAFADADFWNALYDITGSTFHCCFCPFLIEQELVSSFMAFPAKIPDVFASSVPFFVLFITCLHCFG